MNTANSTAMTVFVVAWRFDGGGGFYWYYSAVAADQAFEAEKENTGEFRVQNWTAYRFDFDASSSDPEAITEEIDGILDDLCNAAAVRHPA